jgi:hypothetical protein
LDVGIGLSLTFMVVPQGMSYAVLAGLPAVYGLYGACVPVLVYTLLGTSRHLAVGPTAVSSLLTGSVLRRVYPMAKLISDPNNPGELEDVQKLYNKAAIQVWNSAILQQLSCSGKTRFSGMSFCIIVIFVRFIRAVLAVLWGCFGVVHIADTIYWHLL